MKEETQKSETGEGKATILLRLRALSPLALWLFFPSHLLGPQNQEVGDTDARDLGAERQVVSVLVMALRGHMATPQLPGGFPHCPY